MAILYCQKTIFPNSSAHALHTASTAAHFAGAAVPTSVFPAIPPCGGFGLLEKFYAGIGAHPLPPALRIDAIRCRQTGIYSLPFRYTLPKLSLITL